MWNVFRRNRPLEKAATDLYGSVVAQARNATFYTRDGVPDTAEGRFEMVVLHLYVVIERLRALSQGERTTSAGEQDDPSASLAKTLTSVFVTDMDDNFREMGVGDLSVPRKVKKAAGALYDRTLEYRKLQADGDRAGLGQAIARNVGAEIAQVDGGRLVAYLEACQRLVDGQSGDRLLQGQVQFADPSDATAAA